MEQVFTNNKQVKSSSNNNNSKNNSKQQQQPAWLSKSLDSTVSPVAPPPPLSKPKCQSLGNVVPFARGGAVVATGRRGAKQGSSPALLSSSTTTTQLTAEKSSPQKQPRQQVYSCVATNFEGFLKAWPCEKIVRFWNLQGEAVDLSCNGVLQPIVDQLVDPKGNVYLKSCSPFLHLFAADHILLQVPDSPDTTFVGGPHTTAPSPVTAVPTETDRAPQILSKNRQLLSPVVFYVETVYGQRFRCRDRLVCVDLVQQRLFRNELHSYYVYVKADSDRVKQEAKRRMEEARLQQQQVQQEKTQTSVAQLPVATSLSDPTTTEDMEML